MMCESKIHEDGCLADETGNSPAKLLKILAGLQFCRYVWKAV